MVIEYLSSWTPKFAGTKKAYKFLEKYLCLYRFELFNLNNDHVYDNFLMLFKFICDNVKTDKKINGEDHVHLGDEAIERYTRDRFQLTCSDTRHWISNLLNIDGRWKLYQQYALMPVHMTLYTRYEDGECFKRTRASYFHEKFQVSTPLVFAKGGRLEKFLGEQTVGGKEHEGSVTLTPMAFAETGNLITLSIYFILTVVNDICVHLSTECNRKIVFVQKMEKITDFRKKKNTSLHAKRVVVCSPRATSPIWVIVFMELCCRHVIYGEKFRLTTIMDCSIYIYMGVPTNIQNSFILDGTSPGWVGLRILKFTLVIDKIVVLVSYLPFSHTAGYITDVFLGMTSAATLYFAPPDALKGGTLLSTFQEVRPTSLLAVPRVWEKLAERMMEAASKNTGIKRVVGNWAKKHATNYHNAFRDVRKLSAFQQVNYYLAKVLVLNRIKKMIGFDRMTRFVTGAAAISPDVIDYLTSLDMPVLEGFAMAETMAMGAICQPLPHRYKSGSVGKPLYLNEIRLGNKGDLLEGEGEVLIRGRNVCMGYHGLEEATNQTLDDDSWLHTGDIGRFDSEGFLYITGRIKELVVTAGGENVPPVLIEEIIKKEIPIISNCMLIGDHRKYLSVLVALKSEMDTEGHPLSPLTDFCIEQLRNVGSNATTVEEACKEVEDQPQGPISTAINQGIARYNAHHAVSNAQKVQRWRLLPHDFSLPTGELNNTLKLKRRVAVEKYKKLIDSMYDNKK
ncbi:unnamed protein product, partial [Meganyctiphanes norvegica]